MAVGILAVVVGAIYSASSIVERRYNRVRIRPPYPISVEAAKLQKKLFVADLHADTLLWGCNLLTRTTRGHLDLPRLQQANVSLQFLTVVTTIPRNLISKAIVVRPIWFDISL